MILRYVLLWDIMQRRVLIS